MTVTGCRSVLVAIGVALVPAVAAAQSTSSADASFRAFLVTFEAATTSMLNGDSAPWKALLSAAPGGTLFTPFGGVVRGASVLAQSAAVTRVPSGAGSATEGVPRCSKPKRAS